MRVRARASDVRDIGYDFTFVTRVTVHNFRPLRVSEHGRLFAFLILGKKEKKRTPCRLHVALVCRTGVPGR